MKRSCEGCRAYSDWGTGQLKSCLLRYKTERHSKKYETFKGFYETMRPTEECPKPKTYKEYLRLYEILKEQK